MENGIDRADAFPGNVGNVEQAFYAAEIDECTIGHDLDDRAFEDSAFFNVFEGFFAFCFAFCFEDGFAGKDEAVLVFVDVDDFDLEGLAYEIVQRFNEFDIALGKGNETTQDLMETTRPALFVSLPVHSTSWSFSKASRTSFQSSTFSS